VDMRARNQLSGRAGDTILNNEGGTQIE